MAATHVHLWRADTPIQQPVAGTVWLHPRQRCLFWVQAILQCVPLLSLHVLVPVIQLPSFLYFLLGTLFRLFDRALRGGLCSMQ